ncbi:unnamed protein product, partial [Ectocarpus fasciculatus]
VGIPTGKRRVFIVAVKARGDSSIASKLGRWKQRADHLPPRNPSVGHLLGKTGSFFLRRKEGESGVFSFDGQTIAITQTHIMGRKPQAGAYERHPNDAGPLDDAQELSLEDFAKLTTTLDSFPTPRSLRRSDVAKILEEFTLPPMLREVLNLLSLQNIVQTDTREEEQDLLIGLASLQLDTMETTTDTRDPHEVAMAITSSPNTPPKYKITPAVLRSATRKNRDETTTPAATPATTATQTPSSGQRQRHRNRRTSPPPTPSPPLTRQTPEEIQQDVSKRHSARLEELENILRDTKLLIKSQCRDPILGPIRRQLEKSRGENGDYVLDDQQLLWHAPRGRQYAVATPRHLVPGVLALVHGTFGHPGVARTTLLIEKRYHWPTLKKDTREYVLSCRCRRRKRPWSTQLAMLPARFLQPWEVLEMDIQDMKVTSDGGNRYLLAVVDRGTKFLAAFPLPSKAAEGVSRKLLELLLIFGLPLSIRCDPGGEFIAEVTQ